MDSIRVVDGRTIDGRVFGEVVGVVCFVFFFFLLNIYRI